MTGDSKSAETIPPEAVRELHDLADELAEKADSGKEKHDRDSWQYGQALGYEKAGDELAAILYEHGIGSDDHV